ncbi:hypothetical protein MINTMi198_17840 [Mycobacterium intracellulare M.i.198]|uniref:DUF6378 domain-containing protein n=1 Tax=Mycobacterium intracellulare TaxID=1767 RepID=UPI0002E63528|nr:DUF6378 domain-containing protein [Mycobacterium intracellulare]BCP36414.1 hypothetical protein MINTMi198_17840 [Mycobacterium intracellulare M.i.198]
MTETILDEANRLVNGDRKDTYDGTDDTIVALWSAYLGIELTVLDYASMMVLLKVARTKGKLHRDSWVDIAGYAEVGPRLWEAKQEPEHVAGFEEQQAQIPRVWQSLADVPHDVRVGDKEGDVWIYYDGPRDVGWGWRGRPSPFHPDDYPGPFIEILG